MTTLLSITLMFIGLAHGENGPNLAPNKKTFTNQSKITWEEFKDGIPQVCKGIKSDGHFIQKDACVFWSQDKKEGWSCLIFSKEGLSNDAFAKLIKRCYQS